MYYKIDTKTKEATMALLQIKDLCVSVAQEKKQILSNINLAIEAGQTCVLMGPNGAGKSTLGFSLMGEPNFTIDSGDIILEGQNITNDTADTRAKKGLFLSFQDPQEIPGVSLESFIRASLAQVTGQRVKLFAFQKELKQKMQFLEMQEGYAARDLNVGFSGGEKKKAEILQLLMLKPKLAILDETDSGLDVDAVRIVTAGINEYKKATGGAVFVITHSIRMLENLKIDQVYVMVKGKIVKTGGADLAFYINEHGFDEFLSLAEN